VPDNFYKCELRQGRLITVDIESNIECQLVPNPGCVEGLSGAELDRCTRKVVPRPSVLSTSNLAPCPTGTPLPARYE
jgi:hypothetical protein